MRYTRQVARLQDNIISLKSDRSNATTEFLNSHRRHKEEVDKLIIEYSALRDHVIDVGGAMEADRIVIKESYIKLCTDISDTKHTLKRLRDESQEENDDLLPVDSTIDKPKGVWK